MLPRFGRGSMFFFARLAAIPKHSSTLFILPQAAGRFVGYMLSIERLIVNDHLTFSMALPHPKHHDNQQNGKETETDDGEQRHEPPRLTLDMLCVLPKRDETGQ